MNDIVFNVISACIATMVSTELILRMRIISLAVELGKVGSKSGKVIRSKLISDHWKEKSLSAYSLSIMRLSLTLLLQFILVVLTFSLLYSAGLILLLPGPLAFYSYIERIDTHFAILLSSIIYFVLRRKFILE